MNHCKKWMVGNALLCASLASFAGEIHHFDQVNRQAAGVKGVDMAVLCGKEDDNFAAHAFRIQPGVVIPAHAHSCDYWGVAVQGKWFHIDANGKKVKTGQEEFIRVKGDDVHADSCARPKACINILDFDGARDIMFPKK